MSTQESQPVITAARRTPVGRFLGGLTRVPSPQLGAWAIEAVIQDSKIQTEQVDECIMGNVVSAGLGQAPRATSRPVGRFATLAFCSHHK